MYTCPLVVVVVLCMPLHSRPRRLCYEMVVEGVFEGDGKILSLH